MAAETIVIDVVINSKNNTSSGINSAKSSADKFTQSIKKAKNELDRLGGTNARPKVSLMDRATSTLTEIDRGLTGIGKKSVRATVKVLDYATRPLRAIKNALFSVKGLVAAIGTGWAANKLFSEPLGLADAYSSAKIGFSTLLGDSEGQKMMDKLDEFAKATPFKTSGVIDNAQKMMAMGWNPKDIIKDMETIGDAAAATGKMDQGLESIVRALSQIKTKGKLSTEELNQLSEAGIAAKAMLAEQLGYGTGDKGIAAMTQDLEKGLIGSEVAIQALLQGMEQFDGTMKKTANETVSGLKSQIEDTFEINILRRWGQGLQDGAKRGFGSIVDLLDKSEGSLAKFGDTVYEIGKELSNWAADKLENTIDKIIEITNRDDFKNASLGGKIKILWDEVIAEPFSEWWDSKGKPFIVKKMESIGEGFGSGISKGLLALLGISDDVLGDSMSIGGSFAKGFAKGFEGEKVWDAIVKAAGKAFTKGFSALFNSGPVGKMIAGALAIKVAAGVANGINTVQTLWSGTGAIGGNGAMTLAGMGLKGIIGSSAAGTGILGHGAMTAINLGAGNLAGGASLGTGALSALGLGATAGAVGTIAGVGNSVVDLTKAVKAQTQNDRKLYGTRSATKFGMVGTGAAAGAALGSVIPGLGTAVGALIGGGLGGIATFLAGDKLADSISGVSKSTAELNEEAEELASKRMADRFGEISLSADELAKRITNIYGAHQLSRINKFNQAMSDLQAVQESASNYKGDIDYTHARIMDKEKLSTTDIEEYQAALQGYAGATKQLLSSNKQASRSAFAVLFGDDTKGLQQITKGMNGTYSKLEKELEERTSKLNDVIAEAFEDGKIDINEEKKINEIVKQIEKIQNEVDKRLREKEKAKGEAAMDLIGMKYKDTDLTADSFGKLMDELHEQGEASMKTYDDAYIQAKAELDLEFDGKKHTEAYKKAIAEIEKKWRDGKAITVKKQVNVAFDVINTHYGSKIETFNKNKNSNTIENSLSYTASQMRDKSSYIDGNNKLQAQWDKGISTAMEDLKTSYLKGAGVDEALQKEMKTLYESLKPQEEDLLELKKSYQEAGEEIPKWIEDSLSEISNIKLMSGDMDSFYKILGEQIAKDDPAYAKALQDAKAKGEKVPEALIEGINEGMKGSEVNTKGKVNVDAEVNTENAKQKTKSETEGALGKDQNVNKTANVAVDSKTTGEEAAAAKSKGETKTALDSQYANTVDEMGKVHLTGVKTSGLSAAVSSAWQKFNDSISSIFSTPVEAKGRVKYQIGTSGSSGGKEPKKANGGYVDKAVRTIVGEAGPEMIIPLSANRRERGKYLWERAGRAMGLYDTEKTYMNANGGLYGLGSSRLGEMMNSASSVGNTAKQQTTSGNGTVKVDVGGITIKIESSGDGVQADIANNTDAIASQIAAVLEKAFENMPVSVAFE